MSQKTHKIKNDPLDERGFMHLSVIFIKKKKKHVKNRTPCANVMLSFKTSVAFDVYVKFCITILLPPQ